MGRTAIGLGHEAQMGVPKRRLGQVCRRSVARSAVDHDVLLVGMGLSRDSLDAADQQGPAIARGGDDGEAETASGHQPVMLPCLLPMNPAPPPIARPEWTLTRTA